MPQNTLKLSLAKTAGSKARQVLTIKILIECQKCFEGVLDENCQQQRQTIVNRLRMAKMPHSCAWWEPPEANRIIFDNQNWNHPKNGLERLKVELNENRCRRSQASFDYQNVLSWNGSWWKPLEKWRRSQASLNHQNTLRMSKNGLKIYLMESARGKARRLKTI